MPCLAFKLPSTGSTTTSGSGAPNDRWPTSSDKTENCTPRSASRSPLLIADGVRLIAASGFGGRGGGVDPAPAPASAFDHDRDQVGLLHLPHALDELRDGDAVRFLDAQQDQPLRQVVVELSPVVQVQLLQGFEDVIKTPQTGPAILILRMDHRA